jgi:choline dehydrogenase-like flavoprotein
MKAVVIGSGPAGVSAAHALVAGGAEVTILDAGDTPEPEATAPFRSLAQSDPEMWPADTLAQVRGAFSVGVKSVGVKPAFGSLFPYAIDDPDLKVFTENASSLPSLARGGLSNAWGAAVLPFRQADIMDWPISVAELAPHYEAVLRFVPLAGERDGLQALYPLYGEPRPLRRSVQTAAVLDRLARSTSALSHEGIAFGRSRLAVRAGESSDTARCRYSGLCMYGCPYGSIYTAGDTLDKLIASNAVSYRGGVYVDRVSENGSGVRIDVHERAGSSHSELRADRVFVATGAVSSTRLMLESLGVHTPRRLVDSEYFMIPMLTTRSAPVGSDRLGNTLAQVFLEIEDETISRHTVHLQVYGYNDLMVGALAQALPVGAGRLERALAPLFGRLLAVQGYLHSSESPGLVLSPTADGVRITGESSPSRVRRIARRLATSAHLLGMTPIPGLLQAGTPGKGNHVGGSFPMRREPGALESDVLGRPAGLEKIHLVDGSVLPSIPASTVTFSIMANAHRIATEAIRLHATEAAG